jgi:hypothetical protein
MGKMLHFVSENPYTKVYEPLSKYEKTLRRIKAGAKAKETLLAEDSGLEALRVMIFRQGSFTVATIFIDETQIISQGVAKRNADYDEENPLKGEHLAVRRAIQNLFVEEVRELTINDVDSLGAKVSDENEDGVFEVERVRVEDMILGSTETAASEFNLEALDRIKEFAENAKPDIAIPQRLLLKPSDIERMLKEGKQSPLDR